jgi:hypothetical protein
MIIAVDFDGTLHAGRYPNIGAPAPYAIDVMTRLHEDGHYIIINTCRGGDLLIQAINWLLLHKIPFDRVNDNEPGNTDKYESNSRKIYAHCYIDDKQVGGLPTWPEIYSYISDMEKKYSTFK